MAIYPNAGNLSNIKSIKVDLHLSFKELRAGKASTVQGLVKHVRHYDK